MLSVDKQDVTEGDTVSITCRAEGERGDLFVVINNGSSKLYQEQSSTSEVQKNLRFDHVGTAKLFCSYSIKLGGTVLLSTTSNMVSVVVRGKQMVGYLTLIGQMALIHILRHNHPCTNT